MRLSKEEWSFFGGWASASGFGSKACLRQQTLLWAAAWDSAHHKHVCSGQGGCRKPTTSATDSCHQQVAPACSGPVLLSRCHRLRTMDSLYYAPDSECLQPSKQGRELSEGLRGLLLRAVDKNPPRAVRFKGRGLALILEFLQDRGSSGGRQLKPLHCSLGPSIP